MAAPREVIGLIERFKRNREAYLSNEYNEVQVRLELINPFFKALGWDIDKLSDSDCTAEGYSYQAHWLGGVAEGSTVVGLSFHGFFFSVVHIPYE